MGYFKYPSNGDQTSPPTSQLIVLEGTRRFALYAAYPPIVISDVTGPKATLDLVDQQFDTTSLPDGYYVANASGAPPIAFAIRNGTEPIRGPLVPLIQMPKGASKGQVGAVWIPFPVPVPEGNAVPPRTFAPWTTLPTTTNRAQYWMRPLTAGYSGDEPLPEFREDRDGNVLIGYQQLYSRNVAETYKMGNRRDGKYGRGRVGTPVSARQMLDGSWLMVSINHGVMIIRPDLSVETVWGWRIPGDEPVPHIPLGAADDDAWFESKMEFVGDDAIKPRNPWNAIQDVRPGFEHTIWIANTEGHNVLHYDLNTKTILGVIGSPTAVMGRQDGTGEGVLMRRPRGLAQRADGKLYVGEAWNHMLGLIDPTDYSYAKVWRSAKHWENSPHIDANGEHNTRGTNFLGTVASQLRAYWEGSGTDGVGYCHHIQQIDLDSTGKIVFGTDHTRNVNVYDPETGVMTAGHIQMPDGHFLNVSDYRHKGWVSLAVNRNGSGPMKDAIAFADWDSALELRIYNREGTAYWNMMRIVSAKTYGHRFGRNDRCGTSVYPWCVGWARDGNALVYGDSGRECVLEMSVRQPGDIDIPDADVTAGRAAWKRAAPWPVTLSAHARYSEMGYDQLGGVQFQDMASWTDSAIEDKVVEIAPWLEADKAVVRQYIRYCQLR
jgi:hypothetical protein